MSADYTFLVQGSSPEPYTVEITLNPLTAKCTCQAGMFGAHCKHRIAILDGNGDGVISGDISKLPEIADAAKKANFDAVLDKYQKIKAASDKLKKEADKKFTEYKNARVRRITGELKTDKTVISTIGEIEKIIDDMGEQEKLLIAARVPLSKILVQQEAVFGSET